MSLSDMNLSIRLFSVVLLAILGSAGWSAEIAVEATSGFQWVASSSVAREGDTITFRMSSSPNDIPHGLAFENWGNIKDLFEIEAVQGQQAFNADAGRNDAFTSEANKVFFKATVKTIPDGIDKIEFVCIVHPSMNGSVELATGDEPSLDEVVAKMSPSVQRRMLRFVNRAYSAADLLKSPQEFRTKSEHMSPTMREALSAKSKPSGLDSKVAEAVLEKRPLDGYTDVRQCLPMYGDSGSGALDNILDSLGPSQFGEWDEVITVDEPVMHAAMLHTGQVLLIPDSTNTLLWDPATNSIEVLQGQATGSGLTANLFCSGHSFLSDGRLLVVGGGGDSSGRSSSIQGWKFDPLVKKWSKTSNDMAFRRWYPTLVNLGDEPGRVLVAAGLMGRDPAPRMEIYSEDTDRFVLVTVTGPTGDLLFPGTYPGLHPLPSGQILHVPTGWGVTQSPCNQMPDGATVDPTAIFTFSSPTTGSWTTLGNNNRLKGMSALLVGQDPQFVKGLVVGGGSSGTSTTAQMIELPSVTPNWDAPLTLLEARVHPNIVNLPDGSVFISGGIEGSFPPLPPPNGGRCELLDPETGILTEMDEMTRFRHYHSVAILLPDGRVMAAGGARRGGCTVSEQNTIEVFSPPYLFKGARPVITSAPAVAEHGVFFDIKTPNSSDIEKVVLARPMAVTHQTDTEQRIIPLEFSVADGTTIRATAPGGNLRNPIAPRGHYMLFILNSDGVPSVAEWIHLN